LLVIHYWNLLGLPHENREEEMQSLEEEIRIEAKTLQSFR
jgi:hypothetical protein